MSDPHKPDKDRADAARRERLGAALRENLKRRKDQSRARRPGDPPPPGGDAGPDQDDRR
ncbi:MAG: hypothetical protein AB1749_17100 [Pseudomonadota bacterium]